MARSTFDVEHEYIGAGNLDTYTFDFKIESLQQLQVIVFDENDEEIHRLRGDDTTFIDSVTFDSVEGGGTVVLLADLPEFYRMLLLQANDSPTQEFEFKNKFDFTLRKIEMALDWVLGPVQRLAYLIKRTPKIHEGDDLSGFDNTLPKGIDEQANACLVVNSDADGFDYGPTTDQIANAQGFALAALAAQEAAEVAQAAAEAAAEAAGGGAYTASGYSQRFSEVFDTSDVAETLDQILQIVYTAPLISLSASGSGTIREKGDTLASTTLTATTTKRSDPIAAVRFYLNPSTLLDTQNSGGGIPDGGVNTYAWTGTITDTATFRAEVDDNGDTGGPTTVSATATFTFVYPYYVGAGAPALAAASVAALTKRVITSSSSRTETITATAGQVFYFAYPASYGALSSILDENDFETFGDWTLRTENITGLDGNPVSYRIYEFENPVIAGDYEYTFIR